MRIKHLCVLIHIRNKVGVCTVKHVESFIDFSDSSKAMLLLWIIFVIYVSCLTLLCCLACYLQPCEPSPPPPPLPPDEPLLGKGWPLESLVCYVFLCFCHGPIRCFGSGMVLDWVKLAARISRFFDAFHLLFVTINIWFCLLSI